MKKRSKNIESIYPLSPMQEGMLFHTLYSPDSRAYFEQLSGTLHGELNTNAFEQAWQQVVDRHAVLRTLFIWKKGKKPVQVVRKKVKLPWTTHDWQHLTPALRDERLEIFLEEDRKKGFVLNQAPLMRCSLIQLSDNTHQFTLSLHHLLTDGWSTSILFKEVWSFYAALSQGQHLHLPPLRPYRDYIAWLQQQDKTAAEHFWKERLQSFTAPTALRVEKNAKSESKNHSEQQMQLSTATTAQLQTFAKQHHVTLNTLVQGAWALLLSRYSGEPEVVFGVTVSGRAIDLDGVDTMLGMFINTLPLRVEVQPDTLLLPWLQRLHARHLEQEAYAYTPLVEIQQWSEVPAGIPLFNNILVFENYPEDTSESEQSGTLQISDFHTFEQTNYPLTVTAEPDTEFCIRIEYDNEVFDDTTITRLLGHVQMLLEGIVTHPQQHLSDLPLLTKAEYQQLVVDWNNTKADYPQDECLHQLFETQVAQTPEAIAVVFEEQQLIYRELNSKANQIAHYLRRVGITGNQFVGILEERGIDFLAAMLGILKAGGAFLPIDPSYPDERVRYMVTDSQIRTLITRRTSFDKLANDLEESDHLRHLLFFDGEKGELGGYQFNNCTDIANEPKDNPSHVNESTDVAYMLYTSGSTGLPKGTMVRHNGAVNHIYAEFDELAFHQNTAFLQSAPSSSDISVWQFLAPLLIGGRTVIVDFETVCDPVKLFEVIKSQQVTLIELVPVVMQGVLDQVAQWPPSDRALPALEWAMVTGEAVSAPLVNQWLSTYPNIKLVNAYGPTEAADDICQAVFEKPLPKEQINVPIGKPLSNLSIHVLDPQQQLLPIGVCGEIGVAGVGVGAGYWRNEEKTRASFVKNPYADDPHGNVIYRTGDLGRWLPDGSLEFIGRLDHQVKIRGFRIELGEIEAALGQFPFVKENAVVVHEDESTGKQLVAFCVPEPEQVIDKTELRGFLTERLPDYMVPSAFVTLEAMPLTPNGKMDRRALSMLSVSHDSSKEQLLAPRTPEEELLAGMWADVLGVERVGIHDNFFELGGHSLLAMQLISRLRDTFATELPLRDLFEFPTIANLGERLDMARHERQLPPINPIARTGDLPLSFGQQRLWFLDQLEGPNATYNMPSVLRLVGTLHRAAFEEGLTEMVRRHESLRTTFTTVSGKPHQVIHQSFSPIEEVVDLQPLAAAEQSFEIQRLAQQEAQRPFDLAKGPLVRATLLKLGAEEHVLLFTMHHIISDGWSIEVAIQELSSLYNAFSQGQPSPLPTLPIQYADFASWQRQWLTGEVLEAQLNYWRQQLTGVPALLELPTDYPRPASQSYQGTTQEIQLTAELTQQLKKLSQQTGTTLFMTLLSAFAVLLSRYSGMDDIVIGSPIANRTQSQTESLIGFFVNTLVFRIDLEGNPNVTALLKRVRRVALDAYANQDIPFEQLVEELQPVRSLSHSPLFQVMFVQNVPTESLELAGLSLTPVEPESVVAQFDLSLTMEETSLCLDGTLEYSTDLFEAATMERMMGHLKTLLTGMVANPRQPIHELPLLTEKEQQQLHSWNDTAADYPRDKTLVDLFEEQVDKTPQAIAVVFEKQQLTYQETNIKANQLAHYLQNMGVKPDTLVGICVERSLGMVIGLLGILKAGGAYLPLDPAYPAARLAFMLEDAQVSVVLTQTSLVDELPKTAAQVVCLDAEAETLSWLRVNNPKGGRGQDDLAYVIYTSGSTGQPKGVMISQSAITSHCFCIARNHYQLRSSDRVLQFASVNFDASLEQIFPALITGAMLVLRDAQVWMTTDFHQKILEMGLTVIDLPPTYWQQWSQEWLSTPGLARDTPLRLVIVGGDVMSPEMLRSWQQIPTTHSIRLINAYGPTEATITATIFETTSSSYQHARPQSIPIGHPIANKTIHVLDRYDNLVPIGVPGELHVGGVGLARGYLNRPELTREKFIKNAFGDDPNARLYKTGDLARHLPDGNIEYLGRMDNQVKIRGFRIELGEIEVALGQHPAVRENAVVVHEDGPTGKRLVAFCVPEPEQVIGQTELRGFLKERLPDHMMPSAFVTLENLPLTPNGKVDRGALSQWSVNRETSEEQFVAPRTSEEKRLADIWADVLGVERVGVHDNFFELGGDSIISIQVISRANQTGFKLTPKQLFEHQTIAELATVAGTGLPHQAEQGLIMGAVPLTPIMHEFFEQNLLEPHHYNQAVLVKVSPNLTKPHLERIISQLLKHHDMLRSRVSVNHEFLMTDNCSLTTEVMVKELSELTADQQRTTIESTAAELQASLSLSEGPLLRVALFQMGADQPDRLLVIIHHLVVDGVSWRILLEDFVTAYQQLSRGDPMLPPKTTSFQQWARRLGEYGHSSALAAELEYWLAESRSNVAPLPVDFPSNTQANTVASSAEVSVSLNAEQTRALLTEVPQAYQTQINDVLLTALAQSFAKWTGEPTLLIDLEGHGREELFEDLDISRTLGWFTSLFPVLLDLRAVADNQGSALKTIKEQLRQIPHRGIGHGLLRHLNDEAAPRLQALPQAEVCFNYLGQFTQASYGEPLVGEAPESSGATQSPLGCRTHLLEVNGLIDENGQMQLEWTYSENFHKRATIEKLANHFIEALNNLIAHCQSPDAYGYTPSDFPDTELNQEELDQLIDELNLKQIESVYPLSPMQQGMLFHTLYAPGSGVYVEQLGLRLQGYLNISAFKQAWQRVVERHAVFRTLFVWENRDKPLQVVCKKVDLPWNDLNWRDLKPTEQQAQLDSFLQKDVEQGFALNQAPLMRCTLIQLTGETCHFVWSSHHLLTDGWSLPIIFQELIAFYDAFCQGENRHLEPPRPYKDYIAWLHQQNVEKAQSFWTRQLKGFSAPTPFKVDNPFEISAPKEDFGEQTLQWSKATTESLQTFARQHHLTANTLVQGAWALLLSRYSGEEDVVFGATVSGRPASLADAESMVGLFINTLPVRVSVSSETSLLPWLQQLQAQQVEREQYSYTPLIDIQGWSEVARGLPLFESIVVFENYPIDDSLIDEKQNGLKIDDIQATEMTNYPLTVVAALADSELNLKISYYESRFSADTINRMLGHLQTLLEGIITHFEQKLGDLSLLTEAEQRQLLAWNDTAADYPRDRTLADLFEEQVEKTPDAIAVVFEDQQLTYRTLNTRANQLAHYLQNMGVKPEVLVGICIERSLEMMIGLFGILKAGGAYLPLDPAYPAARLAFMLEDAQVSLLLTQSGLKGRFPEMTVAMVCLDAEVENLSPFRSENLSSDVGAENLAYVIYTSGSTGKPKGVMIHHQALCNHMFWMQGTFPLTLADKVLQKTPFSFDASVWEFYAPLLAGAQLVMVQPEGHKDSRYLIDVVVENNITTLQVVPSLLQVLLQEGLETVRVLKRVFCGGDVLSTAVVEKCFDRLNADIINLYGPTEACIQVTSFICQPSGYQHVVPIGRPIANTHIHILDDHLQLVPVGVPGELHIGGACLAQGYINHMELTAEKFIKNPFSDAPNARLYKTGDLARHLPDGNIEYLGRMDNQVKIRGFRIELGEIEVALGQHPAVRENAVIVHEDSQTDKHLVAYLVPHQGQVIENAELRGFLTERLPDYMIPPVFVTQEALPLTPNGKIDRRALSLLSVDRSKLSEDTFVAPRDALELQLAQIWEDILNVRPIGLHDNFFDLGGHSLLAVRLMATIGRFKNNLPLAALFQGPTIEQLAALLRQDEETDALLWSPLVDLQPNGSQPPFFCVPGEGGNVIYFHELARSLGQDQPFYGLQAVGLDGQSKPYASIEEMAARYVQEIQAVQREGPYLLGGHSFGNQVAFEMSQQLQKQGHEVALLAIIDTFAPHILSDQPGMIWEEEAEWIVDVAETIEHWSGQPLEVSSEVLQPLDADDQWNYFRERLVMANVFPPDVDMEPIRGLVGIFKANRQIRYTPPQDFFPTRIALFQASEAMEGSEEEALSEMRQEPTWGWSRFAAEPVMINVVPGDHITMLNPPHVQVLAEQLKICFEQAVANH